MAQDNRDVLELLKEELRFIEQGGYVRPVDPSKNPALVFRDSLTCINFGFPYRAHPCIECHLLDLVPPEGRSRIMPCHHIPLNEAGETVKELEIQGDQQKRDTVLRDWLRAMIEKIEADRARTGSATAPEGASSNSALHQDSRATEQSNMRMGDQ